MKCEQCVKEGKDYNILGYKGKQVRDNIHSFDLVNTFYHFFKNPKCGEVYNIGGSRFSNCSILEAITLCEKMTDKKLNKRYIDSPRSGDHIWWISDVSKFKKHFPQWEYKYNLQAIVEEIHNGLDSRK